MLNSRILPFFIVFLSFYTPSEAQDNSKGMDARSIIKKSIDAMGGEALLRSVKTMYTEMTTEMEGQPVTWVTKEMLPNKGAFQVVLKGKVVYEDWFNGKRGFELVNGQKTETPSASLEDKFPRKNIFNELEYLDSSLYKIYRMEDTKVKETDCYKIKAVFFLGNERHLYIDKKSFQTIREDRIKQGESVPTSISYTSGFKNYGGLVFYSELLMGDGTEFQKGIVTKILINQGVSDADFNR